MSSRAPKGWTRTLGIVVVVAALPAIALLLAVTTFAILGSAGVLDRVGNASNVDEIFARTYVAWLLVCVAGPLLVSSRLRRRLIERRWTTMLAALFAVGAIFALGDPFSAVRAESNVIRYWTAGVLCVAAAIAIISSLDSSRTALERLLGIAFGLVLILGASDELLELHENVGERLESVLPASGATSGQDLVLLGLAAAGTVVVVISILLWRYMPSVRVAAAQGNYLRAFVFFVLAVLVFGSAMLLDSFDWVLRDAADRIEAFAAGSLGVVGVSWSSDDPVSQAANSVEELLEYLAALLFLMMVGVFFSVRALGWASTTGGEANHVTQPVAPRSPE